jgi:hypothetical protein
MDGEGLREDVESASEGSEGSARRAKLFFTYLGVLLLDVLVLNAALLFPRQSLAYEWMNRIGMFVAIIIVAGLFLLMEWGSTRPWRDLQSRGLRWYMRAFGVLLPVLFTIKAWNRILEALWLR